MGEGTVAWPVSGEGHLPPGSLHFSGSQNIAIPRLIGPWGWGMGGDSGIGLVILGMGLPAQLLRHIWTSLPILLGRGVFI
jgi:hypothetical protein